jgi:hypothetical protein
MEKFVGKDNLRTAQQRKREWVSGLQHSDLFALSPTLARLTLNIHQFSLAFQIPVLVLNKFRKSEYCLVGVAHGGNWTMRAVRLNEITGRKDVSLKLQLYTDLIRFIASSHPDEISSRLRQEVDAIFRSLPRGKREELKSQGRDPDCLFSTPQECFKQGHFALSSNTH